MGLADFYTNAAGQTASSAAAPAAQLALPAPAAEAPGFLGGLRAALPTLGGALRATPSALATVPMLQSVHNAFTNLGLGFTNQGAGSPELQAYNAAEQSRLAGLDADPTVPASVKLGNHIGSYVGTHARLLGENLSPFADAVSGAGGLLSGLFGGDGKTTAPKTSLAGQAASTGGTPQPTAVEDKRPVLKLSELPALNLAQLKMLQPFLPKQPGPADNMKGTYLDILEGQYAAALKEANGNADKINAARKARIQGWISAIQPGAAGPAYVMPPTQDYGG